MRKAELSLACSVALALSLAGCCRQTTLAAVSSQSDTFEQSGADSVSAKFTQRPALVDLLFVVDNSPSMCAKQDKLAANFQGFIDSIQTEGIDFHIGVTTTDFSNPKFQGRLVAGPGSTTVLTSATPNLAEAFGANVKVVGVQGSPDSQPLLAAAVAVQEPLASGDNQGFLRPDAALAAILVTDEDDYSLMIPPQNPIEDPMPHYFTRVFKRLKGPGNDGLVTVSAIVGADPTTGLAAACNVAGTNDANCNYTDNSANAANRILAVVAGTSGIGQSICVTDFATLLSNLGRLIGGLSRRFDISAAPIGQSLQTGSLAVVVTPPGGQAQTIPQNDQTGWHYDANAKSVEFIGSYAPPPGSEVAITFATLLETFKLTHPAAVNTLLVKVTPKGGATQNVPPGSLDPQTGWIYDSASQSIVFPPANIPPLGATIEVDYAFGS